MKRKIVIQAISLMTLIGSFAFTQEWSFGGSVRYRNEAINKDFSDSTGFNYLNYQRTRLNVKYKKENATVFFQMQDSRVLGTETHTLTDGSADALDMHQAYVQLSNSGPFALKIGRYEIAYGSQRIIGPVGWHNIGRSFDGITFTHKMTDGTIVDYFNLKLIEGYPIEEKEDINVRGLNAKFGEGIPFLREGLFVQDKDRLTVLLTLTQKMNNLRFNGEVGYQSGKMDDQSLGGWMVSAKGFYKINSVTFHLGVDIVSGDDPSSMKNESFNTLFGTNHKFYGHMDYFLNVPVHSQGLGLVDTYFQATTSIVGLRLNTVVHHFKSQQTNREGKDTFGTEIDNNLSFPLFKTAIAVVGHSLFFPGELMAIDGKLAQWGYVMLTVSI